MEYKNIDFNADKVKQYEAVREAMARIYEEGTDFLRAACYLGSLDLEQERDAVRLLVQGNTV